MNLREDDLGLLLEPADSLTIDCVEARDAIRRTISAARATIAAWRPRPCPERNRHV